MQQRRLYTHATAGLISRPIKRPFQPRSPRHRQKIVSARGLQGAADEKPASSALTPSGIRLTVKCHRGDWPSSSVWRNLHLNRRCRPSGCKKAAAAGENTMIWHPLLLLFFQPLFFYFFSIRGMLVVPFRGNEAEWPPRGRAEREAMIVYGSG